MLVSKVVPKWLTRLFCFQTDTPIEELQIIKTILFCRQLCQFSHRVHVPCSHMLVDRRANKLMHSAL